MDACASLNSQPRDRVSDVDKLLFPVKLGPHLFVMLGALSGGGLTTSCGYRSVYADSQRAERFVVVSPLHARREALPV